MDHTDVLRGWADRSGEFSPAYYAYYGPDGTSDLVFDVLDDVLDRDASVLELGCSSGRHLANLHAHGYTDLFGVDVNGDAFEVMTTEYPDLAESGTFRRTPLEELVVDVADDRFDAVFSVETLQHLHPEGAWVFDELARITRTRLVTVENEGTTADRRTADPHYVRDDVPLYHRDWGRVFAGTGLVEVRTEPAGHNTLRAFEPAASG